MNVVRASTNTQKELTPPEAAKIAACHALYIKYNGRRHHLIETEMRESGWPDFSRRILYPRKTGRGKRDGWIVEYEWNMGKTSPRCKGAMAAAGRQDACAPVGVGVGRQDDCAPVGVGVGRQDACAPVGVGVGRRDDCAPVDVGVGRQDACAPVGRQDACAPVGVGVGRQDACAPVGDDFPEFQAWLRRVSPHMTWDWRHQRYLYKYLQRVTDGVCDRLMINMPPRHGKSEMVSVRYAAWRMLRRPETKVILASYGQDLANTFSRGIKRVICDDLALSASAAAPDGDCGSARYESERRNTGLCDKCRAKKSETGNREHVRHRAFETRSCRFEQPEKQGFCTNCDAELPLANVADSGNADRLRMFPFASQRPVNTAAQWGTAVGGGLRAVGVGGGVTGFGADLIVIDDPVKNRAQAESETFRNRVWDWYRDDLYTRLEPGGAIILIQTRWHEDDLAGRLLKQMDEGGEHWEVVNLPAIAGGEFGESGELVLESDETTNAVISTETEMEPEDETDFKPKIIGFPPLYSRFNAGKAAAGKAAAGSAAALGCNAGSAAALGCKAGSSGLMDGGLKMIGDEIEPPHRHGGGTAVGKQDACAPVSHGGGTAVGRQDACAPVGYAVGRQDACAPVGYAVGGQDACAPIDVIGRLPGDALCPERYDLEKLAAIRSQLGTYGFSALYQQRPTPAEGAIFKREWFRDIVDAAPPGLKWFRGYDLAISTRTTADYTASFRVAMDELGFMYIADGFRARIEYPEQRRYIIERIRAERDTLHGIEDSGHGKALFHELRRQLRLMQYAFRLIPVSADKVTRALTWSPIAEEGKVKLVRGRWIDDFLNEITPFPNAAHDDQADAVSIAVGMMAEPRDRRLYRF